jgi:glycosyltransferase involved in cell wall biosynthesis
VVPRILHLSASFPRSASDATAPFLLDLLTVQRAAGWDARAVGLHDAGLPTVQVINGVPVRRARYGPDQWEVLAFRGGGHGRLQRRAHALLLPGMVLSLMVAALREVVSFRPRVVHAHWLLPNGLIAVLLPGRHRVVLTLHGNDVQLASRPAAAPMARWVARRADAVLAVSEPLARHAEKVLGLAAGSVSVAQLPLPPDLVPAPPPPGARRLLAAGRSSSEKGFDVLLDALALPGGRAWRATIVTEGPVLAELEQQAASLDGRVTMLPLVSREALFDLMRDHHLIVVPSREEGLGMVAVEALALGRPVVASDVGGLPETVEDGVDGRLVPADDPAALAAVLDDLAEGDLPVPRGASVRRHRGDAVLAVHAAAYGEMAA